jgi:hypothetical protein
VFGGECISVQLCGGTEEWWWRRLSLPSALPCRDLPACEGRRTRFLALRTSLGSESVPEENRSVLLSSYKQEEYNACDFDLYSYCQQINL